MEDRHNQIPSITGCILAMLDHSKELPSTENPRVACSHILQAKYKRATQLSVQEETSKESPVTWIFLWEPLIIPDIPTCPERLTCMCKPTELHTRVKNAQQATNIVLVTSPNARVRYIIRAPHRDAIQYLRIKAFRLRPPTSCHERNLGG